MNFVIFGGTTEGRELSCFLAERGATVTVCVATDYGRETQGVHPGITILAGRKNRMEMETVLRGADLCVDATHPYAAEATKTIRAACQTVNIPYRRLLRAACDGSDCVQVPDAAQAAAYLQNVEGNILLTTGTKELHYFSALDPVRLYVRILPAHEGLDICQALGIPRRNIIAIQGPFSQELNEALFRQYHIACLVTKDGGTAGGFPEKVRAAKAVGAAVVLIQRPAECGNSFEEIAAMCEKLTDCAGEVEECL